jgi:hypothetical protein
MVIWTSAAPREDSTMDEMAATVAASKWGGMIRHDSYRAVDRPRVRAVFTSSRGRWRPGRAVRVPLSAKRELGSANKGSAATCDHWLAMSPPAAG